MGFPGGSDSKESACNIGDPGSIPGSERSPGEENGNLLQYSCLENPMDRSIQVFRVQYTQHGLTYHTFTDQLWYLCNRGELSNLSEF